MNDRSAMPCVCESPYNFTDLPLPECPVHGENARSKRFGDVLEEHKKLVHRLEKQEHDRRYNAYLKRIGRLNQ